MPQSRSRLRVAPPPGRRVARSLEVAHSLGYRPGVQGGLPRLARAAANADRLVRCFQRRPISTALFCLLDPWTPKLASNRSEAPLAFRMKSSDFLNSSGHSCIRSGPCAFPTQRVKFVFEGWGRVKLKIFSTPAHSHTPIPAELFPQVFPFFGFPDIASSEPDGGSGRLISGQQLVARFLASVRESQNRRERGQPLLGFPTAL